MGRVKKLLYLLTFTWIEYSLNSVGFVIMKSDFKTRPVYLSKNDRIIAHFTTYFLSLIILRFLEKRLTVQFRNSPYFWIKVNGFGNFFKFYYTSCCMDTYFVYFFRNPMYDMNRLDKNSNTHIFHIPHIWFYFLF